MKYNDYELLYMVRENDEFSSRILLEKYYPIKKIFLLNIIISIKILVMI